MFSQFLAATRSEPFEWGQNDCALWCASAVQSVSGIDPAADLRGSYSSRFECLRLIMNAGGLVALVAPRMAAAGLVPLDGDGVAVIRAGSQTLCGVIVDGRAVVKTETGLRLWDEFQILRGWSWRQR